MISALKFFAGFLSNILCQIPRSFANLVSCLILAVLAVINMTLGILRLVGGGRLVGVDSLKNSWILIGLSLRKGSDALLQAISILSLVGPLVRASQSCLEDFAPSGVYAPSDPRRNNIQAVLGWNSWNATTPPQKAIKDAPQKAIKDAPQKAIKDAPQKVWNDFLHDYLKAKTRKEADRARMSIFLKNPVKYCMLLEVAKSNCSKRKRFL